MVGAVYLPCKIYRFFPAALILSAASAFYGAQDNVLLPEFSIGFVEVIDAGRFNRAAADLILYRCHPTLHAYRWREVGAAHPSPGL